MLGTACLAAQVLEGRRLYVGWVGCLASRVLEGSRLRVAHGLRWSRAEGLERMQKKGRCEDESRVPGSAGSARAARLASRRE